MQRIIYPVTQHLLKRDQIDKDALYVMEKLRAAGYIAYLVGGSVRDLLLNKQPKDYDISTSAQPEEIKHLFRNCILIGRRFRLAHIRFGKKILEVSTFRSGDTDNDALIVRDNNWGSTEEDVLRRDFTINGLFYDSSNEEIIDYVGGYPDIEKKYLRTIGQPFVRFRQDPVRMLRLLKFQARFGFEIDKEAHIALLDCRSEIMKSSSARVLEELLRMLESGASHAFFKLLADYGLLQLMLPAVAKFLETIQGEEIYAFLQEIDTLFHELPSPDIDRSILLSCLVYPLFHTRIQSQFIDRNRIPHLGEIQHEAHQLIDEVFSTFLHITRRLRIGIVAILTGQYRITPIEKRQMRRLRIPKDPDFSLALQFFQLRACLEPGLQKIWNQWNDASSQAKSPPKPRHSPRKNAPAK